MTSAEFQKMASIEAAVLRVEQRLLDHIEAERMLWERRQGLAPWLSFVAAIAAVAVSVAALVGR